MHFENANDVPSTIEMEVEGENIKKILTDNLGLKSLKKGCYTYLHYSFEFGEGEFWTNGKVYANNELTDIDPSNNECVEMDISSCNPEPSKANIRLKNSTAFDFCNVEMDINSQENALFGNLASGESTCYIAFESLKRYPLQCRFMLGDEEFIIENPTFHERLDELSAGFYTYNITIINPSTKFGDIQLSND